MAKNSEEPKRIDPHGNPDPSSSLTEHVFRTRTGPVTIDVDPEKGYFYIYLGLAEGDPIPSLDDCKIEIIGSLCNAVEAENCPVIYLAKDKDGFLVGLEVI